MAGHSDASCDVMPAGLNLDSYRDHFRGRNRVHKIDIYNDDIMFYLFEVLKYVLQINYYITASFLSWSILWFVSYYLTKVLTTSLTLVIVIVGTVQLTQVKRFSLSGNVMSLVKRFHKESQFSWYDKTCILTRPKIISKNSAPSYYKCNV